MKRILIAVFFAALFTNAFAQSERYAGAMQKNLETFSAAKSPAEMHDLSNAFERIADAEKTQWLPYYYAAMTEVLNGFMATDKSGADVIADRAELLINKADALEPKNSEISCIKSMIASLRMMVDPMQRWQQYGALSSQLLEEAKETGSNQSTSVCIAGTKPFIHLHNSAEDAQLQNQWQRKV
ncbi:MAG: hypothetical protein IPK31_10795 [Chitinophagaceae bacterium]|nr:hypothetical protein [Chitinophagaceae bacterium]